ncbi:Alpha/Beta hydrolase protein [Pelagophyceae sp. CCMP2097]|nr:Alpha/Beta hydrolase protein [Pelagophyceae sp. CCMP2097]
MFAAAARGLAPETRVSAGPREAMGRRYMDALAAASGVDSATFENGGVRVCRSRPDVVGDVKVASVLHFEVALPVRGLRLVGTFADVASDVKARSKSPSGALVAIFRDGGAGLFLEIYDKEGTLLHQRPVGKVGKLLCGDVMVGGLDWSDDETLLCFVADAPVEENKECSPFEFRPELGEKYAGVSTPTVFVMQVHGDAEPIAVAKPEGCAFCGQPAFSLEGDRLAFVGWTRPAFSLEGGWKAEARPPLGLVYCFNRPASIYVGNVDAAGAVSAARDVTPRDVLARSPRWRPGSKEIAYLGSVVGFDTHDGPISLRLVNVAEATSTTLVGPEEGVLADGAFPGLWGCANLPARPWHRKGRALSLTSLWRSAPTPLLYDDATRTVAPLARDATAAETILACTDNYVLTLKSSFQDPAGELRIFNVNSAAELVATHALPPIGNALAKAQLKKGALRCYVLDVRTEHGSFESIVVTPAAPRAKMPLVILPHGGPHSATTVAYSPAVAFLASMGYVVLAVNYRGSIGFGSKMLESLRGKIGQQDVADCVSAARELLRLKPEALDAGSLCVVGGSHGGFLAAHLLGQYADFFRCGAARNPVTNLAAMVGVTDIPDWCAVEGGVPRGSPAAPAALERLYDLSPVKHVERIRAPFLIAVGLCDRRVPPSQGLDFYHALCERGRTTKLLTYPQDDHAIDKPKSDADHWTQVGLWFNKYAPVPAAAD